MKRSLLSKSMLAFGVLFSIGPAFAIPILSTIPNMPSASVGQNIFVDVAIEGVDGLAGYDITVLYDPSILSFSGVNQGNFLQTGGSAFWIGITGPNAPGVVGNVVEALLNSPTGASGQGLLFTVEFTVIGWGVTPIEIGQLSLLSDLGAHSMEYEIANGQFEGIGECFIPEPGTWALLLCGVAGSVLLKIRSSRKNRHSIG